jgi:plasmid maintenance system antidote protein VapI
MEHQPTTPKPFGKVIAALLMEKRRQHKELASHIGVSAPTLSRIINGSRCANVEEIIRIASFFQCEALEIIENTDIKTEKLIHELSGSSQIIELSKKCVRIGQENSSLQHKNQELEKENGALSQEIIKFKQKIAEEDSKLKKLSRELESEKREKEAIEKRLIKSQHDLEELKRISQQLHTGMQQTKEQALLAGLLGFGLGRASNG